MKLFSKSHVVGIFKGFSNSRGGGALEFHSELILPYRRDFQTIPIHGQFVIIQLDTEIEGVLGRITSVSSGGRLSDSEGEDYGVRAILDDRPIPEELREQYLKYRVDIRVLGVVRIVSDKLIYAPSHRRLPHVGAKVAFLQEDLLREVVNHNLSDGVELGHYALGEFVYAGDDPRFYSENWIRVLNPPITPRFSVKNLVSKRTFVFARAGFGKSNLNKYLFSSLYKETPWVEKKEGRKVPVGTILFDPDGEYFWPDDKGRPGLCDVPHLKDKIVIFTNRQGPSLYYGSFIASGIKLDIRRLKPVDVLGLALSLEKQEQQNVRKLRGLSQQSWRLLVDEIYRNGNLADAMLLMDLLHLAPTNEAEMSAARSNMTFVVQLLHDPASQMLDMLLNALKEGKICIIDVSQYRGEAALILSSIVLKKIFDFNQDQFTSASPETIPTIAVIEEAQSVLGSKGGSPAYTAWVKEGRKFDLGAVMITQQPGSISPEILSQGDNWFVFHLLSAGDLITLKQANAHFSDDILSSLLNEPIIGHAVFWTSATRNSYPIPVRVMSFEKMYSAVDGQYKGVAEETYASSLKKRFTSVITETVRKVQEISPIQEIGQPPEPGTDEKSLDMDKLYMQEAIRVVSQDLGLLNELKDRGKPWKGITVAIAASLPDIIELSERDRMAYDMVRPVLDTVLGDKGWEIEKRPSKSQPGKMTSWVVARKSP